MMKTYSQTIQKTEKQFRKREFVASEERLKRGVNFSDVEVFLRERKKTEKKEIEIEIEGN